MFYGVGPIFQEKMNDMKVKNMVVQVVKFSSGGVQIGKIFAYKTTYTKEIIEF